MKKIFFYFLLFLILVSSTNVVYGINERISSYVVDNANVFSLDIKQSLNDALKELEQKTNGTQIVVFTEYTIPSGMTLEERSLNIAENNGVGQKKYDNGLLFYIATQDRQYRWEVGYGLEPTFNSAWLGRVSREFMVPKFQQGDFEGGILVGLAKVEDKLLNNTDSNITTDNFSNNISVGSNFLFYSIIIEFLMANPIFFFLLIMLIVYIIKRMARKQDPKKIDDNHFISAASGIFFGGRGGGGFAGSGGGFSGGGGSFGGGGFSGRF